MSLIYFTPSSMDLSSGECFRIHDPMVLISAQKLGCECLFVPPQLNVILRRSRINVSKREKNIIFNVKIFILTPEKLQYFIYQCKLSCVPYVSSIYTDIENSKGCKFRNHYENLPMQ